MCYALALSRTEAKLDVKIDDEGSHQHPMTLSCSRIPV